MTLNGQTTDCHLLDLTEQGLQLQTSLPLKAGDAVQIECQLSAEHHLRCTLRVIHAEGLRAGGLIASISPDNHRQVMHFLSEHNPPHHNTR